MTTPDSSSWLGQVREFALNRREGIDIPDGHELGPLENFKRRATGGVLLQFLDFLQTGQALEIFDSALEKFPLHARSFLFITDLPGAVAAGELMQADSEHAFCILREEWRAWLADEAREQDAAFLEHFEFWSVWHQEIHPEWEFDSGLDFEELTQDGAEFWVHEEGFALAPNAGRGAQHLWLWDGAEMKKVQEAITSWTSIPGKDS